MNNAAYSNWIASAQRPSFWDRPIGRIFVYSMMLLFCIVSWALIILGGMKLAHAAGSLDCETVQGSDQRHYCRAVTIPRPSECELIKSSDLRFQCRAVAR